MTTTTQKFVTGHSDWILVASGKASVSVANPSSLYGKLHIGSVKPALDTQDYLTLISGVENAVNLGGLSGTDKVYVMAFYGEVGSVVVIASDS